MKRFKYAALAAAVAVAALAPATASNAASGWNQDAKGWWYQNSDGSYTANAWQEIGGQWYFFTADGYMDYSEYRDGYWLSADGAWDTTTTTASWKSNDKGWWIEAESGWYPTNEWLWVNGSDYFFKANGYMAANEYVGGYWVGEDGAWDSTAAVASWYQDDNGWYYQSASGWYPADESYTIDGITYDFDANGYLKSYTVFTPSAESTATLSIDLTGADKAQAGKDFNTLLSAVLSNDDSKKITVNGAEKTVSKKNGVVAVDDEAAESYFASVADKADVKVELNANTAKVLSALELAGFAGTGSYKYNVTVGDAKFTDLTVSADGLTFTVNDTTYNADVVAGKLYVEGKVSEADFAKALKANGIVEDAETPVVDHK